MQSLGLQHFLVEIVHCTIPAHSRPICISHCTIPRANQPLNSLYCLLCNSDSKSPGLPVKIVQSFPAVPQVCCMSILKFSLVFKTNRFLAMHVAMSLDIVGLHPSLNSSVSMASKRAGSKDTNQSTTRTIVERVSMSFLIYEETKLIIEKTSS